MPEEKNGKFEGRNQSWQNRVQLNNLYLTLCPKPNSEKVLLGSINSTH